MSPSARYVATTAGENARRHAGDTPVFWFASLRISHSPVTRTSHTSDTSMTRAEKTHAANQYRPNQPIPGPDSAGCRKDQGTIYSYPVDATFLVRLLAKCGTWVGR